MKCAQCQSLIDDIGDMDRLPIDAARHVASCSECERFGVQLIALRRLLREPARVAAPENFDFGLARRLREAKANPPSRIAVVWSLRPQTSLAAAAAFLLVCSGALVVSRYSMSPDAGSARPVVVATNRATETDVSRPGNVSVLPETSVTGEDPGLAQVSSVSTSGARSQRSSSRNRFSGRRAGTGDAMLLVSDDHGSRLVSVPDVLIGSEMIVPLNSTAGGDSPETVSF